MKDQPATTPLPSRASPVSMMYPPSPTRLPRHRSCTGLGRPSGLWIAVLTAFWPAARAGSTLGGEGAAAEGGRLEADSDEEEEDDAADGLTSCSKGFLAPSVFLRLFMLRADSQKETGTDARSRPERVYAGLGELACFANAEKKGESCGDSWAADSTWLMSM